jgi:hypothetical protein
MNRRRFIALIGAAVPGLWVDGIGLIELPRRMVISLSGRCSFCGKDAREVFGLAGVMKRHARICSECIDICLEIIWEDVQRDYLNPPTPPPSGRFFQSAESIGAFEFEATEIMRSDNMRRIGVDLDAFIEVLRKHIDQSESDRIIQQPKAQLACSFCNRKETEIKKLIAGPQVLICEVCTGDAAALIKMHR